MNLSKPCHRARGHIRKDGYMQCWFRGGHEYSHRATWIEKRGPIPDGLLVLHHCDVRWCDEITHLYLGTHADNARDREMRGRRHQSGLANGNAKLTPECVREIRAARGKVPQRELAARYGVCQRTIVKIQLGLNWKEVT